MELRVAYIKLRVPPYACMVPLVNPLGGDPKRNMELPVWSYVWYGRHGINVSSTLFGTVNCPTPKIGCACAPCVQLSRCDNPAF